MTATSSSTPGGRVSSFRWVSAACSSGRHAQLRRPPGHRLAQAHAAERVRLERDDYADIVFAFQVATPSPALRGPHDGQVRHAPRLLVAIIVWSLARWPTRRRLGSDRVAAMLSVVGLVYTGSVSGFIAARFVLGLANPGISRHRSAVAEWFPRRSAPGDRHLQFRHQRRALIVPLAVPWITVTYGWYWAFVATGAIGFFWLFLWWPLYKSPSTIRR